MAEIFETVMLICFGLSWPVNLVKNLRAKTAKGTSLGFILLILFGYIAGITAKFVSGNLSYVLVAYLINLVMVSLNLAVYYRNRAFDMNKSEEDTKGKKSKKKK